MSYFVFFLRRHTIVSGSRPLPGLMSPRRSIALMVLRLADRGRISSLFFKRRRTGLPRSESVSSWYPSWMCESRACSVSVSFGETLGVFFFAMLLVHILLVFNLGFGADSRNYGCDRDSRRDEL